MSECDEYNGWVNRETWAANLWLSNDQGFYEGIREYVADRFAWHDDIEEAAERREVVVYDVAGYIENMLTELCDADTYRDTFGCEQPAPVVTMADEIGSRWRIDYRSIAEPWVQDWEVEQS